MTKSNKTVNSDSSFERNKTSSINFKKQGHSLHNAVNTNLPESDECLESDIEESIGDDSTCYMDWVPSNNDLKDTESDEDYLEVLKFVQ